MSDTYSIFRAPDLLRFIHGQRDRFAGYTFWRLLSIAVVVPFPFITQQIIDHELPKNDLTGVLLWSGYAIVLLLFHIVTMSKAIPRIARASETLLVAMRARIFEKLQFLHFGFLDRTQAGRLLSKYAFDTMHIDGVLNGLASAIVPELARALLLILMLTLLNPLLLLFILVSVPIFVWTRWRYFRKLEHHNHLVRMAREKLTGRASEFISAIKLVRGFGQEREVTEQMEEASGNFAAEKRDQIMVNSRLGMMLWSASNGISILSVAFCGVFVLKDQMSLGTLVALVGSIPIILQPVNSISQFSLQYFLGRESYRSIKELVDSGYVEKWRGGSFPSAMQGRITFEGVNFSYDDGPDVIQDFTLEIKPGEHVAFVGPSGSGKSTTVNLILGLYAPRTGRILVDGVPQDELDVRRLRRQCAIVMQDNLLLSGTISDNIRFGRPEASEAEVVNAAREANAEEFIERLEDGYETKVGERGVSLSGGQRQRIAIARALLRNPRILILDEATSALDYQSERLVQEALDRLCAGRTTITIAHRLSTVRAADTVVVMRDGRIVEKGPYGALANRKGGAFAELLAVQEGV
ncbi:MAG: ABC transporter ATP-binding protein [Opitutales bacterium]